MGKPKKILLITLLSLILALSLGVGGWLWYDNNVDRSGWVENEGTYYYKDFYGDYVAGWREIGESIYYFSPENLTMATYWQDIEGKRYYFSGDGTMDTGLWDIDGKCYYFDETGAMATGWQQVADSRYFFAADGTMLTGWLEQGDGVYYFRQDGKMAVGLILIDGLHYRFQEDGRMYTGWDTLEEELVYYTEDGARAIGWLTIHDKLYYFDESGAMVTGWITLGEYSYYLTQDGSAAVGPTEIDGNTYYFTPQGIHVVLVNAWNPVPSYYNVELRTVEGDHQVSVVCYDALVRMLADCRAAGFQYNFNSAHRTVAEQTQILRLRTQENMDKNPDLTYAQAQSIALQSVAVPGTSEHHLGLAVDLLGNEAIAWFHEHCWEYGFIVRYRGEKSHITGIINEPWHFRYVGVEVAMAMRDNGLSLEEYLGAAPIEEPEPEPEETQPTDPPEEPEPVETESTDPTQTTPEA